MSFTPLPGAWRTGDRAYDVHTFHNGDSNEVPVFYRSHSAQTTDRSSGAVDPRRIWEVRTPTGLHSIPNYPAQPPSRQVVYVHGGDAGRGFNPRLREIFQQPSPRTARQTSTQVPRPVENSRAAALSKLKKEVYNPTPKRLAKRLNLYYRENMANASQERAKEKDEEDKSCVVCLEDFEPKEEVMLTPCNHMFHEGCIVPWVTSKGQCPVCRFVIIENVRGNSSSLNNRNNNNITNLEPNGLIAGELLSILRAMEEAFQLGINIH